MVVLIIEEGMMIKMMIMMMITPNNNSHNKNTGSANSHVCSLPPKFFPYSGCVEKDSMHKLNSTDVTCLSKVHGVEWKGHMKGLIDLYAST